MQYKYLQKITKYLLVSCLFFMIVACNNQSNQTNSDVNNEEHEQGDQTEQTITIALGHGLDYLGVDPFGVGRENTVLLTVVYEPLAIETSVGEYEGVLAESWSVDETGTEWTFQLREDVMFQDGTPFNSHAVEKAFQHYLENASFSRRAGIESMETPDDYTVIFKLKKPFAPFLKLVGSYQCVIPSPNSYDDEGNFSEVIGTGPYVLKELQRDKVEFVANEHHWREKPSIEQLNVIYISDPTTMALALEAGEVDLIGADGYGIPQAEIKRLQENSSFKVITNTDSASLEWIGFNMYDGPLSDINVRKALNYAIDRKQIIDFIFEGYATPAVGPIGFDHSIPWTDPSIEGYTYDLEKAEQLLAEAGWIERNQDGYLTKDGQVFELTFILEGTRTWKPVGETIKNQLAQIGINVNLEMRDGSIIRDLVQKGEFDMVGLGSVGKSVADPYYFFQYYFTTNGVGTVVKDNEKLDQLIADVVVTMDTDKRAEIYNEIQREIMELAPGALLLHPNRVTIMDQDIEGWDFAGSMDPLRFVYKLSR